MPLIGQQDGHSGLIIPTPVVQRGPPFPPKLE